MLRRGDFLVVHAKSEAEEALRRIGGSGVPHSDRVIRTFLPVHELGGEIPSRDEARASLGITSRNVALFFGHVRPFKALDVALRAWSRLATHDALLLVAGEAWWNSAEEYRKLAQELGIRHSDRSGTTTEAHAAGDPRPAEFVDGNQNVNTVLFEFRFIPDSEIATYFAAADVVLAPYRVEAQSGVALAAFHFARPVIASNVGGLPEVVAEGENGYLVRPDDPDDLARAIDLFFAQKDREKMERAAAGAAKRCSWEEYGRVFARLVEFIPGEASGPSSKSFERPGKSEK